MPPLAFVLPSAAALFVLIACAVLARRPSALLPLDGPEYRDFAASLDATIAVISADPGRVLWASPGFEKLFGVGPDRLSFGSLEGLVHEEDRGSLEAALEAGRVRPFEVEFRLAGAGEPRWLRIRGFPVLRGGKAARRIALWIEDRSRRKNDELMLVEALDYEVSVGARIQRALLLGNPEKAYKGFELASMTLPSQKIDGDFIDFFDGGDEVLDLMLGDVMGKGIPAALTGAAARNAFVRARLALMDEAKVSRPPVKDIVRAAERRIAGKLMELRTFFTLVYGRLDGREGLYRFVDCGHTSVLHFERRTGRCWKLKGANAPMGFLPEQEYTEYSVPVSPGDLLFLYSDGITEAANSEGEQFGEDRLMKLVRSNSGLGAVELLEKVKHIAFSYASGEFKDDVTAVAVRIASAPRIRRASRTFPQSMDSLRGLREFYRECVDRGLSPYLSSEARESVLIALGEAASNVFRHSVPEVPGDCRAAFRVSESWAAFYLYYRGSDYEWQKPEAPAIESFPSGGYGLYLINQAMDSVTVSPGEDGAVRLCMLIDLASRTRG
ncbi:MAG: SpoIIE family protein phosphatase [Treponema sp.]|nr:SpoIIE family protein phosphatase [Treponema sp.]